MNIIKQAGGNVVLTDSAGNILKSFINVNALDIVSDNEIIIKYGYNQWHSIFASVLQFTQVEPAAAVAWSGDSYALAAILSTDFFYVSSGSGPCPPNLTTAKLMKTGQTVSQQTGDDGDIEAGRDVDFFTLAENNVFGNTNRFTDELGTQTYTLGIVIDWSTYDGSTVLGWNRTVRGGGPVRTWSQNIADALLLNIGGFSSGWRIPNITELLSIIVFRYNPVQFLNYSPFNILGNLSTSTRASTVDIYKINISSVQVPASFSIVNRFSQFNNYIVCRVFTVTGTILT